jgi:hypothetical protein
VPPTPMSTWEMPGSISRGGSSGCFKRGL